MTTHHAVSQGLDGTSAPQGPVATPTGPAAESHPRTGAAWCGLLTLLLALLTLPAAAAPPLPPPLLRPPVPGAVMREFAAPAQRWGAGHRGVDLLAPPGTQVLAGADGVVAFAGTVVDRQVLSLEIAHGYRLTHEPVRALVRPGQRVVAGQVIGVVLAGEALHWGLKHGKDYLDPTTRLRQDSEVRLLPEGLPAPPARPSTVSLPPLLSAGPLPAASSGLVRPVAGPHTSRFGPRLHPVLGVWKLHDGLDYGAACGTPVRSSAAGRVVQVQRHIAYGNRVVVDHGTIKGRAVRTSYNHLAGLDVSPGAVLSQGQQLGRVGNTGYSTGCHLHHMVWADGALQDPQQWL
ncbi:peptidoglycan DD-metalloendopeptidase family protein [Luteococcus sp. OSA5]|uniref:M23 family metallopeptidase n=1 Tax=Luteococcus sp. OSA5 TaxID=3401630 RepID=UPI003B433684